MVPSVCEVAFQGIVKDSMSWKVLGVIDIQFPSSCQGCPPKTSYHIRRKEITTCGHSCQIANIIACPFIQYILIMDSLEHISIANVPALGPTSSVFTVPRASCEGPRCIP